MPLYEYECKSCSNRFEQLVRASDGAPACPSCNSHELEKLLSAFSVATGPSSASVQPAMSPCGRCGDPRGPGACSLN